MSASRAERKELAQQAADVILKQGYSAFLEWIAKNKENHAASNASKQIFREVQRRGRRAIYLQGL